MITKKVINTKVYETANRKHTLTTTLVSYYSGPCSEYKDWVIEHTYKTRNGHCTRRIAFGDTSDYQHYLAKLIYKYGFNMAEPVMSCVKAEQLKLSF